MVWPVIARVVIAVGGAAIKAAPKAMKALKEALKKKPKKDANPKNCPTCKASRKQVEEEANVKQVTKGKTAHGEKSGGLGNANKDFDRLQPNNVKDISTKYGPGRTGTLDNGDSVVVRPGSSDSRPTLEIRNPANGRGTEIRYNP